MGARDEEHGRGAATGRRHEWERSRRARQGAILAGAIALVAVAAMVVGNVGDASGDPGRNASPASRSVVATRPAMSPAVGPETGPAVSRERLLRQDARFSHTTTTTSPYPAVPADSGTGRRIVYCNSCQRVWIVEADGHVTVSYLVSGRRGVPRPGTYQVHRKLVSGWHETLRLPYFVGFAWGSTTDIGFHGIPLRADGSPIQADAELGQYRSLGCARQNQGMAKVLYDWAQVGDTVVVTA